MPSKLIPKRTFGILLYVHAVMASTDAPPESAGREPVTTSSQHRELNYRVDACFQRIRATPIPAHCWVASIRKAPGEPLRDEVALEFCRRKVYTKYLASLESFYGPELPSRDPPECEPYTLIYNAIPVDYTMEKSYDPRWPDKSRGEALFAMLYLVKELHEKGFAHQQIELSAFGVEKGLISRNLGADLFTDDLKLSHLGKVRSIYLLDGSFDFEVLQARKQDLVDFADKILERLFPGHGMVAVFRDRVEQTRLTSLFDFEYWFKIFTRCAEGQDVVMEDVVRATRVLRAADSLSIMRNSEETRRSCIQALVKGDLVNCPTSSEPKLKPFSISSDTTQYCDVVAALATLSGLGGRAPRIHRHTVGSSATCLMIDDLGTPLPLDGLIASRHRLNEAMSMLIQALKTMHMHGMLHNKLSDPRSIHYSVTADGLMNIYLAGFEKTSSFVKSDGFHKSRTPVSKSRRSDMRDIAYLAAQALDFKDPLMNEFFVEMDALGFESSPNYDKWIRSFKSESRRTRQKVVSLSAARSNAVIHTTPYAEKDVEPAVQATTLDV